MKNGNTLKPCERNTLFQTTLWQQISNPSTSIKIINSNFYEVSFLITCYTRINQLFSSRVSEKKPTSLNWSAARRRCPLWWSGIWWVKLFPCLRFCIKRNLLSGYFATSGYEDGALQDFIHTSYFVLVDSKSKFEVSVMVQRMKRSPIFARISSFY